MSCILCENQGMFLCSCSGVLVCVGHLEAHVATQGTHSFESLSISISQPESEILTKELFRRIQTIVNAKIAISLHIEKLIVSIKQLEVSVINNLDQFTMKYVNLLNQNYYAKAQIMEMEKLTSTDLIIKPIRAEIFSEIEKAFLDNLVSEIKSDPKNKLETEQKNNFMLSLGIEGYYEKFHSFNTPPIEIRFSNNGEYSFVCKIYLGKEQLGIFI